jgi:hypothetical protein
LHDLNLKKDKVVDITIFYKHEKAQYSGISSHLQCWNISNFAQCSASGDNEGPMGHLVTVRESTGHLVTMREWGDTALPCDYPIPSKVCPLATLFPKVKFQNSRHRWKMRIYDMQSPPEQSIAQVSFLPKIRATL